MAGLRYKTSALLNESAVAVEVYADDGLCDGWIN
jgi:hypothetical protein